MNYERFTVKARGSRRRRSRAARQRRCAHHFLMVLCKRARQRLLKHVGVPLQEFTRDATRLLESLPKVSGGSKARVSRHLNDVFGKADGVARELGDSHIASEVLFVAIEAVDDKTRHLLHQYGLKRIAQNALKILRGGALRRKRRRQLGAPTSSRTDRRCARRKDGPRGWVGHSPRCSRRGVQNNPVLIGEPGVSSAIIEEFAANCDG